MLSLLTMIMSEIWWHILDCVVVIVVVDENWRMAYLLFLWLLLLYWFLLLFMMRIVARASGTSVTLWRVNSAAAARVPPALHCCSRCSALQLY